MAHAITCTFHACLMRARCAPPFGISAACGACLMHAPCPMHVPCMPHACPVRPHAALMLHAVHASCIPHACPMSYACSMHASCVPCAPPCGVNAPCGACLMHAPCPPMHAPCMPHA
eukprot:365026-Chlamydomonas_euryale.AAC.6